MANNIQSKRDAVVEAAKAWKNCPSKEDVAKEDAVYRAVTALEEAERPSRVEVIERCLRQAGVYSAGRSHIDGHAISMTSTSIAGDIDQALSEWESK